MNWDQIEDKWDQVRDKIKEKWGQLTGDDLTMIRSKRDQLAGEIQEYCGYMKGRAEDELKARKHDTR